MSGFKLSMDTGGGSGDFIADSGNLDNIFSEFMDEPVKMPVTNEQNTKTTNGSQPVASTPSVTILAKVVLAFKLVNSENVPQGNVGLALIQEKSLRIILYRTKQDILSSFTLATPNSVIYAKSEYIQFRDDTTQFWSIRFSVGVDRDEFLTAVREKCSIEHETSTKPEAWADPTPVVEEVAISTVSKPSLVSRMAKMGGHQLPLSQVKRSSKESTSDSDDVETIPIAKPVKHQIVPSKWKPDVPSRLQPNHHHYSSDRNSPLVPANTLISYNPLEQEMLSLFTENRFQNTEVRMGLSKLEMKIERVLDKMDNINRSQGQANEAKPKSDLEEEIIKLEEKMLGLKKENRLLRMARDEERDQRCELNSTSERLQTELIIKKQLQSERDGLQKELNELRAEMSEKSAELEQIRLDQTTAKTDYEIQCSSMQKQIDELTIKCDKQSQLIVSTSKEMEREKNETNDRESRLEDTVKELQLQVAQHQNQAGAPTSDMSAVVKDIMNNMYQKFQESIVQRGEWSPDEVLKLMRVIIKRETMNALSSSN